MASSPFTDQVRLLVALLPSVAKQECFALKGGTAINLYLRDMPRLSVDIDLAYLPVEDRDTSLEAIDAALKAIVDDIHQHVPRTHLKESFLKDTGKRFKLTVWRDDVSVKIEVTPVLRGSVYPAEIRDLSSKATQAFGSAPMTLLSEDDLYAGKICAALDRQHPRDLYDVYWLLKDRGIDTHLKDAFLVYLMGHNRPMADLLAPRAKDIEPAFRSQFEGMTYDTISLRQLQETLPQLVDEIHAALTDADRRFLVSLKEGTQEWRDFPLPGVEQLPSIRWKVFNIARMAPDKRQQSVDKLKAILFER
jgi:predicted nucleotidyltransferase component of viral defense system